MTNRNQTLTKSRPVQVFKNTCQTKSGSLTYERRYNYLVSSNSPFVGGELVLKENTLSRKLSHMTDQGMVVQGSKGSCSMTWYTSNVFPNDYSFANYLSQSSVLTTDRAVSKWYSSLNQIKVNTAEMFATRKQTVDLIANNARRLAFLYRSLRRGTNPFAGNRSINPQNASAIWLENVYGWQPLLSDVHAAMSGEISDPPPIMHKKGARDSFYKELELTSSVAFPGYLRKTGWIIDGYTHTTVRAQIVVSDPSLAFAKTLGLTNPALLAWELLPYSFVVDWFLPIGPWLDAQQALVGLRVINPSVTKTIVYFASGTSRATGSNAYIKVDGATGSCVLNGRTKTRTLVLPSLPLPKLKNPVSVTHALNAIALLGVQFGRR